MCINWNPSVYQKWTKSPQSPLWLTLSTSEKLNQIDVILLSKCRISLSFFLFSKGSIRAFFYLNKIWSNFTWIWSVTTKMLPLFVYVQRFLSFFLFFDVRSILFFKCMKLCNVCYACTSIFYWHVVFFINISIWFFKKFQVSSNSIFCLYSCCHSLF
jgi:hypothetical protein